MTTLIWKELRENLKWAFLAMLVLGGAEFYTLYHTANGETDTNYIRGMTVAKDSFLTVTTFGSAIIAFLLGLIQIVPELNRDRWAALLHRPLPRGRILLGKILAGLLLYAIAVLPPFLTCVWLAATPGHFPSPFVPALALPGIADSCAGLVYYFAGLAVALQRGGLAPLRALPVLAAIHVSYFVVGTNAFADALWAAILMAATLCVAAWGAIYHMDSFGPRPWPAKIALLAVAFYGVCGAGDLGRSAIEAGRSGYFNGVRYELSDEGRPLKVTYLDGTAVSVQEMDGKTSTSPSLRPDRIRSHIRYMSSCSSYIGNSHGWRPPWLNRPYRMTYGYIETSNPYAYPKYEQWFYLVKQRTVIGMSPHNKAEIARLDQQGFQPPSATPVPFSPNVTISSAGQDGYNLWTPDNVRYVNLPMRRITDLILPLPSPISGVTNVYLRDSRVWLTVVALSTGLAIYTQKDGNLLTTLPYHPDVERWGQIRIDSNVAGDRFYVHYEPSMWIPKKERVQMPSYLEEVEIKGEALHSYTLPPALEFPSPGHWIDLPNRVLQSPAFFFGTMLYQKAGAALGNGRLRAALAAQFGDNSHKTKETALYIFLLSLLCAGATLYWARRAQTPRAQAWVWAAFALVFNLAGLIVFRLVADWPQLVPCTTCRQPRPVDREQCPHCAHGWPPPQPNGTEILDYDQLNGFATTPTA